MEIGGTLPPRRAGITGFSEKSRQRLRLSLAKVDQGKCGTPIFGTLTYPAEFPLDEETFKRHLKIFSQRFLRAFPHAAFHWKLEFQSRGAAHFHPIFWNLSADREYLKHFRGWLASNWFEVMRSGDEKHFWAGTSADMIKSQFGIMRYVSGYISFGPNKTRIQGRPVLGDCWEIKRSLGEGKRDRAYNRTRQTR